MATYTDDSGNILGTRIASARKAKGYTQGQLATLIADTGRRSHPYTIGAISQWELGRKKPSIDTLKSIADVLGVSLFYLTGATGSMDPNAKPEQIEEESEPVPKGQEVPRTVKSEKIPLVDYIYYDKKPVFVVFPNKEFADQWGILDMKRKVISALVGKISLLNHSVSLFPYEVYSYPAYKKRVAKPIPMANLDKAHQVWIEMNSSDDAVRSLYNGWYIHNQNHTALINISNNLILTYSGYGVAYRAYNEPYDIF